MEKLGLNEIREKYLSFFQSKGHLRLESFPLVPQHDPSLLLIPAGMAPLKPYFMGELTPPSTTPPDIPQTGMVWWPVLLLAGVGLILFLSGWVMHHQWRKGQKK